MGPSMFSFLEGFLILLAFFMVYYLRELTIFTQQSLLNASTEFIRDSITVYIVYMLIVVLALSLFFLPEDLDDDGYLALGRILQFCC